MKKNIGTLLASSILFVGCAPNLNSDPNREICLSYGYRLGTDGFADCMLEQEKMNRKDSRRYNKYSSAYDAPTVHTYNSSKSKVTHNVQQTAVQNVVSNTNHFNSSSSSVDDGFYEQTGKSRKKYLKSDEKVRQQEAAREEERRQQRLAEQRMEEARQRSIRQAQERQQEAAREEERRQQRLAEQRMEEARQRSMRQAQERQQQEAAQASIPVAPPPPSVVSNAVGGAKSFHDELAEKLKKRRQQIGE